MPVRTVAGLMSGTSMDALDVAICRIAKGDPPRLLEIVATHSEPWPAPVRATLLAAATLPLPALCRLDRELGRTFAAVTAAAAERAGVRLDLVGSHGQTVHHEHKLTTLQIGEPGFLAATLGCPIVADFRRQDIVAGGCGAPLVSICDIWLLARDEGPILALNLGGIANVTAVPRHGDTVSPVIGFDCGPASMVLDELARLATAGRLDHDHDGELAARGRVDQALLADLLADPVFAQPPPRSLGREQFGAPFTQALKARQQPRSMQDWCDLLATATAFTAAAVTQSCRRWATGLGPPVELVASGGGVRNPTLMRALGDAMAPLPVVTADARGLSAAFKEAIAFALLASARVDNVAGNVPSVTGAVRPVLLGKLVEC